VIPTTHHEAAYSDHYAPALASPPSPRIEPTDLQPTGPSHRSLTQNPDAQELHTIVTTVPHTPPSTPPHSPPPSPPLPQPQHPALQRHFPYASPSEELLTHYDAQTNCAYIPFSLGNDHWRQYTHPNGSLYWTCPSRRVVMDHFPGPGTIHTLHTLLGELENMVDIDQWELYVSTKSRHFIHHGSRSMSKDSRLLDLFEQIDRARSNIQSSEYGLIFCEVNSNPSL
jgi:hypothetical protein